MRACPMAGRVCLVTGRSRAAGYEHCNHAPPRARRLCCRCDGQQVRSFAGELIRTVFAKELLEEEREILRDPLTPEHTRDELAREMDFRASRGETP